MDGLLYSSPKGNSVKIRGIPFWTVAHSDHHIDCTCYLLSSVTGIMAEQNAPRVLSEGAYVFFILIDILITWH